MRHSATPTRGSSPSRARAPPPPPPAEAFNDLAMEPVPRSGAGENISVTVRFRSLSEREFRRRDEIAWYPDSDKIVRNESNSVTAYAFDMLCRLIMQLVGTCILGEGIKRWELELKA